MLVSRLSTPVKDMTPPLFLLDDLFLAIWLPTDRAR